LQAQGLHQTQHLLEQGLVGTKPEANRSATLLLGRILINKARGKSVCNPVVGADSNQGILWEPL